MHLRTDSASAAGPGPGAGTEPAPGTGLDQGLDQGLDPLAEAALGGPRHSFEDAGPARYVNRELSWLDFASRLLDLAEDPSLPLMERVKFLAIFSGGLDEFFQVRVAGLKDQVAAGVRLRSPDGRTPLEQLHDVRQKVIELNEREERIFLHEVLPALRAEGIHVLGWAELDDAGREELLGVFERDIFPVLTPLAVDPGHPFPYISNLSLNLAVVVGDQVKKEHRFARVKVPPLLPRFVPLADGKRFVPLEQLIAAHLSLLFPDMTIGATHTFRVTRNADLSVDEGEADDLLLAVEIELRRRRFGRAVCVQVDPDMPAHLRELLVTELELGTDDVYETSAPIDLGQMWELFRIDRPELHVPSWTPVTPTSLMNPDDEAIDMFAAIREQDILLHHPYDSFAASVEAFIAQAAEDPSVLAIKQTLYRTSGKTSIVSALIRAAGAGKQVVVLIELKARFDEQANIAWARELEQAGVHVVYGFVGLKTHSKTALVVRREEDGIRRYCHVGTGNYNSETARQYDDLGLLSADPDLGADLTDLFNYLTGYSRPSAERKLILAPSRLRPWVLEQIAAQAALGAAGRITIKVNGLTDPEVIDALYAASQAGVQIDLVVRGVCCLRPGVPGMSETIRVRSIVGRWLEHSRIYRFGEGGGARYFIGSADLMDRNLNRRVEALVPITDPALCDRLEEILTLDLADDVSAWEIGPDGCGRRVPRVKGVSAQAGLAELARERARTRHVLDPLPGGPPPGWIG